tara:strand:+ start:1365 stop:2519 length:1155 start_codon:yes stop_codon:yes gene_type:complete
VSPIVTISGGGIIGNYISIRLNKSNIKSVIIEKSIKHDELKEKIRTLTLNSFSKKLLDDLDIKLDYAEINKINVFDAEGSGEITFSADEIKEEDLSYVIFFNDLLLELQKKAISSTFFNNEVKELKELSNDDCDILLSDGKRLQTKIIAGCDGRNSNIAKLSLFEPVTSDYKQTAITFNVKASLENKNIAYQIFSDKGIFAIMPLPYMVDEATHSIVWSVENEKIKDSNSKDYINKNILYFANKLKTEIKICSNNYTFNLSNHYFKDYVSGSSVLLGDAAHSIHPLAGQGINLGFADADVFCEEVIKGFEKSVHLEKKLILKKYEIRRKNMNLIMLKSMDFFVTLFRSDNLYIKLLRNIGFSMVNKTQFLKRFFINHAAGKNRL